MQITIEDYAIWIQKYGKEVVSAFFVGWTSFYQDLLPQSEYIISDAFYVTGIVAPGATQFQKIGTQSKKAFQLIIAMMTDMQILITIIPTNILQQLIVYIMLSLKSQLNTIDMTLLQNDCFNKYDVTWLFVL